MMRRLHTHKWTGKNRNETRGQRIMHCMVSINQLTSSMHGNIDSGSLKDNIWTKGKRCSDDTIEIDREKVVQGEREAQRETLG